MLILPGSEISGKTKPRQYGPLSYVRSCVMRNCDKLGIPAPLGCFPIWEGGGNPHNVLTGEQGTLYGSTAPIWEIGPNGLQLNWQATNTGFLFYSAHAGMTYGSSDTWSAFALARTKESTSVTPIVSPGYTANSYYHGVSLQYLNTTRTSIVSDAYETATTATQDTSNGALIASGGANYSSTSRKSWQRHNNVTVSGTGTSLAGNRASITRLGLGLYSDATPSGYRPIINLVYFWPTWAMQDINFELLSDLPYLLIVENKPSIIFDYGAAPSLSATQIDAYISSSLTSTSLLDALISSSMVSSIGFDSLVSLAKSGNLSFDSLIQSTKAINVSIDAMLSAAKAGAVDIDALVFALLSKSIGIDAIISSGLSAMLGMDAMVQSEIFKSVGLDAILQGGTSSFSSIDALIQSAKSSSIGFDALISTEEVKTLILDALITATKSGHVSLDAIIATAGATEAWAGLDALVMAVQSKTISIDAMLSESADVSAQMDALIALLSIQSVGLDALVLSAKYGYLSLDALIMLSGADQVSMDAIIALVSSGYISMDAFVAIIETTTVAVDAIVLAGKYLGLSIDAIVGALSIRPREIIQSPGMAKTIAGEFRAKILSGQLRTKIIN